MATQSLEITVTFDPIFHCWCLPSAVTLLTKIESRESFKVMKFIFCIAHTYSWIHPIVRRPHLKTQLVNMQAPFQHQRQVIFIVTSFSSVNCFPFKHQNFVFLAVSPLHSSLFCVLVFACVRKRERNTSNSYCTLEYVVEFGKSNANIVMVFLFLQIPKKSICESGMRNNVKLSRTQDWNHKMAAKFLVET